MDKEKSALIAEDFYKKWNQLALDLAQSKESSFHLSILAQTRVIMSDKVPVASTDGLNLLVNPETWGSYSPAIREAIITHRLWNIVGQHAVRRGERDKELFAKACAYSVNYMLYSHGYKIPNEALNHEYKDLTPEAIYDILYKKQPPPPSGGGGGQQPPPKGDQDTTGAKALMSNGLMEPQDVEDALGDSQPVDAYGDKVEPNLPSDETGESWQDKCDDNVRQAHAMNKSTGGEDVGMMPSYIKLLIDSLYEPRINTQELVRKYITEQARNVFSYARPRKRYMPDLILPSLMGKDLGGIASAFDISGSVSDNQIKVFNSESAFIQNVLKPKNHTLMSFDTRIHDVWELQKGDILGELAFTGRGGTSLQCVFDFVNKMEKKPKLLMVYSDLFCSPIEDEPDYPVLWLCFNNPSAKVHFGELIHVDADNF